VALATFFTGASLAVAGTASAATVVANGCTGSVTGKTGDQVAVSGPALRELVRQSTQESVNLLNLLTVQPDAVADAIASNASIPVGSIPGQKTGEVAGSAIGSAVASSLANANGLGLLPATRQAVLSHIQQRVSGRCGLTTLASDYPPPSSSSPNSPSPSSHTPSTQPQTNPGANTTGQQGGGAAAPTSVGTAGSATPPGTKAPTTGSAAGQSNQSQGQQFTILDPTTPPDGPAIHNTGEAQALTSKVSSDSLGLPILLAVLALAGVSAALVRTWVLRRS
jgi:hypothetical protein